MSFDPVFTGTAQNSSLRIYTIDEVYELETFAVSVYTLQNQSPEFLNNVTIHFNGAIFVISPDNENYEVILTAPDVDENSTFFITATKEGYVNTTKNITILPKRRLVITPDVYTVDANTQFSVLITDDNGQPVNGVTVAIESFIGEDSLGVTNPDGRAWLVAPSDLQEIRLLAQKQGYHDGNPLTIKVNIPPSFVDLLERYPYSPIIVAIFLLLGAIIFVHIKQKKARMIPLSMQPPEQHPRDEEEKPLESHRERFFKKNLLYHTTKKRGSSSNEKDLDNESKIEEIRINKPSNEKKIVAILSKKTGDTSTTHSKNIKREHEWFRGKDDLRYEIDKITGSIDEKGIDRWFEGMDNLRLKIDEKIKNKDKKKPPFTE
jgi:hypothetical protein